MVRFWIVGRLPLLHDVDLQAGVTELLAQGALNRVHDGSPPADETCRGKRSDIHDYVAVHGLHRYRRHIRARRSRLQQRVNDDAELFRLGHDGTVPGTGSTSSTATHCRIRRGFACYPSDGALGLRRLAPCRKDSSRGGRGELRERIEELLDEYRHAVHDALNDLTEDEARRRLVPSQTTLLGPVKHATFVEGVWFDQAITGRTYANIGIPATVDGSFALSADDTIETIQQIDQERWETSRQNLAALDLDEVVTGRAARPVWALLLQVLRELAQHACHADILREQILAGRVALPMPGGRDASQ